MQKSTSSDWVRAAPGSEAQAHQPSAVGPLQGDFLDLRRIVRILVRERWLIGTPVAVGLFIVLMYLAISPVRYTGVAQLILGSEKPNIIRGEDFTPSLDLNRLMVGPVLDSEVEIILSNRIAERAIKQANLMPLLDAQDESTGLRGLLSLFRSDERPPETPEDKLAQAIGKLHRWLDVRRKGLTLIIIVQYTHPEPKAAIQITNAIVRAYLDEQLDRKAKMTQVVVDKLRVRVAELRKELFASEVRLQEYKEKSLAKNDVNLFELERQAKVTTDLYLSLLARLSEAEAAKGLIYADASIVAHATDPPDASVPNKLIPLALALMAGLAVGVAFALVKDHLSTVIRHPDDASHSLGVPLIGTTPMLLAEPDRIMREVLVNRSSPFSQAIFSMKHSLLGAGDRVPPQLLAIVSAHDGEGKSVIASNFAHYAAASGLKTLLVDCDLRNPQLTSQLAPTLKKSFIDVAKREAEMADVLIQDAESGLFFCPGQHGEVFGNPMEILASQEMLEFLSAGRQLFDLIVLDTSALLPVVDARALVKSVDVAMLVLESGRTTIEDARQALWSEPSLIGKASAILNKCN